MKKGLILLVVFLISTAFTKNSRDKNKDELQINSVLTAWHKAAATANFEAYFACMTPDCVFIGTDATENWNTGNFKAWAKPFFDRGKAWNFTTIERHIYIDTSGKMAWFDELLSTQMKICRGSGVLVKTGSVWKIKHYVLSMTVPNDNVDAVLKIKAPIEDALIQNQQEKHDTNKEDK